MWKRIIESGLAHALSVSRAVALQQGARAAIGQLSAAAFAGSP
jgi:hypothetical protein